MLKSCYDSAAFPNAVTCGNWTRDATGQITDFSQGQANAALFLFESLQLFASYDFEVADVIGRLQSNWAGKAMGNFETRVRLDHPLERRVSVVGEPNDNTLGGYGDPSWSGSFDFIWTGENTRIFWRSLWRKEPLLDPTGNDRYEDLQGNEVSRGKSRWISNLTLSYNLDSFFPGAPERTMVQLGIGNLFDHKPNLIQETSGMFGTPELLGRNFTLTIQGNY